MSSKLGAALLAFQKAAPSLRPDATNPHYKNRYLSLESLMAAVRPVLNAHGLVLLQHPTILDGQPALRTKLLHAESGECEEDTMLLLPGKVDPQGQGSALTYGRRYAAMALLGLVADEDDDGNASARPASATSQPRFTPPSPPAMPAEEQQLVAEAQRLSTLLSHLASELGAGAATSAAIASSASSKTREQHIDWLRRQIVTAEKNLAERDKAA